MVSTGLALATALAAMPPTLPWGKGESLEEKVALEKVAVCTDGKSHDIVVAPHERQLVQLYYGDGKAFVQVPSPPWTLDGSWFLEPRQYNKRNNDNLRGVDLRVYSHVDYDKDKKTCTVTCGDRTTQLTVMPSADAAKLVLASRFDQTPQKYAPHALLRDTEGQYFYVDKGMDADHEKEFRLFVGPKGSLKLQKMKNIVADSEGEIFSTANGELRMVVDRTAESLWIVKGKKRTLKSVPLEDNLALIYNDLGVYSGTRLGTPCDDL